MTDFETSFLDENEIENEPEDLEDDESDGEPLLPGEKDDLEDLLDNGFDDDWFADSASTPAAAKGARPLPTAPTRGLHPAILKGRAQEELGV